MSVDSESSAYLQRRLAVFAKVTFWAFVGLRLAEVALYQSYPDVTPENYRTIVTIGGGSLVLLATAWFVLQRHALSARTLAAIDVALMAGCGAIFGLTAILAWDRSESAYTCLVYATLMVCVRTIIVPSSGRRTLVISIVAFIPLDVAAGYLARTTFQDIPGEGFFAGGVMYGGVAVAIAATGSRVIYGLRRRVSADLALGQYVLSRKIGDGAIGEVYVAKHALLRRPTAIKLVHPSRIGSDILERYERAVQQMSQLSHHNTVAVYDYGRSPDGVFYFAMEYLEGISLDVLIERFGAQPRERVIGILLQLCRALHEAHARGLAHGNIKASNVILCERGGLCDVAKLTDFGFATAIATPADDLRALATLAGALIGDSATADPIAACCREAASPKALADSLRALGTTWTPTQARVWWTEYHKTSAPFLQVPTRLAVDLGRRALGT